MPVCRQACLEEKPKVRGVPASRDPLLPTGCPYLLNSGQALELGAGEVLLLERGRLQHEVLLLCRVHLLQVLCCRVGLPVQRLLDHLWGGNVAPGCATNPQCPPTLQCPPDSYLHGLAIRDAAVDGDLGPRWARGCGAGGRWGRATGAAGGSQSWELLILHGGAEAGWRKWVRLELRGRNKSEGVSLAPHVWMRNRGLESQRRKVE